MPTPNAYQSTDGTFYITMPYEGVMQVGTKVAYAHMTEENARVLWESLGKLFQPPADSPSAEPKRCQAFVPTLYPGTPMVQCAKPIHHDEVEHEGPGPQGPVKWYPVRRPGVTNDTATLLLRRLLSCGTITEEDGQAVFRFQALGVFLSDDEMNLILDLDLLPSPTKPMSEPVYGTILPGWNIILRQNGGGETLHFDNLEQLAAYVKSLPTMEA